MKKETTEKSSVVEDKRGTLGSVSEEALERAMRVAIDKGVFQKFAPLDLYLENWKKIEACIKAALEG